MKTTMNPEIPGELIEDLTGTEPGHETMLAVTDFAERADVMEWDGRGDDDYDSEAAASPESSVE